MQFGAWWNEHAENCCAGILAAWCHVTSADADARALDAATRGDNFAVVAAYAADPDAVAAAADAARAAYAARDAYLAARAADAFAAAAAAARAASFATAKDARYLADIIAADMVTLKDAGPEGLRASGLWPTEAPSNWVESWQDYLARLAKRDGRLSELLQGIADGKTRAEEVARWLVGWFYGRQAGNDGAGSGDGVKGDPHAGDSPPGDATEARRARASVAGIQPEGRESRDCLGRGKVVEALAQLVAEREGDRHLALGLFGPWGSGKSSTIDQLSTFLRKAHPEIRTAEFNAWKNEKATNLGAMLAQAVVDSLTQDLGKLAKLDLAIRLNWLRRERDRQAVARDLDRLRPWLLLAGPPILTLFVVLALIWALPIDLGRSHEPWLKGLASAASLAVAYKGFAGFLERNLTAWFKRLGVEQPATLLRLPDYAGDRGILGEIHLTLMQLCSLCLGRENGATDSRPRQLLLVVDDLDRCGINTVKEVLDAVRLVVDIPHVTTLVAIDERMAFAAVEKHYDQFGHAGRPPAQVAREYLAKVLQVSLVLPAVDRDGVRQYVHEKLFQGVAWLDDAKPVVAGSDDVAPAGERQTGQRPDGGQAPGPQAVPDDAPPLPQPPEPVPAPPGGGDRLPPPAAWPAEKRLFCDLVDAYDFGNPRLMLRLEITWRLLKSLWFGKAGYRYEDAEILLRLLFWREYCLQQTAERIRELEAGLVAGEVSGFRQNLRAALGSLPGLLKQGTIMELPAGRVLATVDAVLLPAAPPKPEALAHRPPLQRRREAGYRFSGCGPGRQLPAGLFVGRRW